ncbi:MAG TPA: PQQ-binding-like beta-propeller repeat protein [Anaerolineaceae bacterium]|mgnify:CR=1 FL=1|nr:PQQ-binding-like beta-propeller repeat protein [Anaerolineaceae bacterium]
MKKQIFKLVLLAVISLLLLSGCAVGPIAQSTPGLSANDTHVFVSAQSKVYKIDLETGMEVWQYPVDKTRMVAYAPVLLDGEDLIFGDMFNKLYRLNIDNPQQKVWEFLDAKGWYQAKVAQADGIIVAPNTDRNVYGINANDGTLKWTHEDNFAFISEPVIIGETVVISSQDHEILWLDLQTGEEIDALSMQGAVIASPFYLEETRLIYVGSLGNEFIAIDANTHQVKWRYDGSIEKLSGIWARPIYLQGQLIFNDDLGNIVSVDPKTGAENWVLIEQGKMFAGLVAVNEDSFLVAAENGSVRAFDINRKPLLQFEIEKATIYTTPIVTDNLIIIAPMGAKYLLYAYPIEITGLPQWTFPPEK